ncbi:MAG: AfsR/SARP family transcriptional regulator [Thiolinea sp.]
MTQPIITNSALICDHSNHGFLEQSLSVLPEHQPVLWVSDRPLPSFKITPGWQINFARANLETVPLNLEAVQQALYAEIRKTDDEPILLVDMSWGLTSVSAIANFEWWGMLCDSLHDKTNQPIISIYNRSLLIEEQLLAALRGHQQFLSPQGVHANPFWLPPDLLRNAALEQQIDFLLGRLMPDYEYQAVINDETRNAASGSNPEWIRSPKRVRPLRVGDERWKIRCFGQLRIYNADGQKINWQIPGSAPKKTRALFAYLLQRAEKGASAERIAEFLWPQEEDETIKRSRLHHCIAMLRKTLGHKDYLQRSGDYYQLIPPPGSWIDVANFEQLCRQSKVMANAGQEDEALTILRAAERLYTGDLFEDLLPEYVESELEDWCLPQRQWFRDMAIKVHRDLAILLRHKKQYKEAIHCCQQALELDAASEMTHAEAMRIFHEQSRFDAIERQYRQYLTALAKLGIQQASASMQQLLQTMIPGHTNT